MKTDATVGQTTQNFEHVYSHDLHLGSREVTNPNNPVNGKVWRWGEGAGPEVIEAPQRYSASGVQYYQVNDERNAQRKTYRAGSVTAGDYNDDSRYAEWQQVNGSVVPCRVALGPNLSELFSAYNLTLDADRASSAATSSALSLAATDLEYEVTRVKSPVLGRDLNPMGRGDGTYYCNGGNLAPSGSIAIMGARPSLVGEIAYGFGSAVNNRELPSWEWLNRIMRAQMFCPLYIVTCPTYLGSMDDPCEGMDTSDPWVLCCLCMPAMCGECPPCSPTRGCCHVKLPGFGTYCATPPPPWDCDKIREQCNLVKGLYYTIYEKAGCGIIGKPYMYRGRDSGNRMWTQQGCKALERAFRDPGPPPPWEHPGFGKWCGDAYWAYGYGNSLCRHEAECCP